MALNIRMTVTEAGRDLGRWLLDYAATLGAAAFVAGVALILFTVLRAHEGRLIEQLLESEGRTVSSEMTRALEARSRAIREFAQRWESVADPRRAAWESDAGLLAAADPVYRAFEWRDAEFQPLWSTPLTARLPGAELDSTYEADRVNGVVGSLRAPAGVASPSFPGPGGRRMIMFAAPLSRDGARIGAIDAVTRAADLISVIIEPATRRGYSVAVREGPYHVFGPRASVEGAAAELWKRTVLVRAGELVWAVDYWPGGELLDRLRSFGPPLVLLLGLFAAMAVAVLVRAREVARRSTSASSSMRVRDVPAGEGVDARAASVAPAPQSGAATEAAPQSEAAPAPQSSED